MKGLPPKEEGLIYGFPDVFGLHYLFNCKWRNVTLPGLVVISYLSSTLPVLPIVNEARSKSSPQQLVGR